jgi:DHA1 family bicyclomycin/chloramphenicol resistance-like MFS transporter
MAADAFFGLYGPAGVPAEAVNRIDRAVADALKDPVIQEKIVGFGLATIVRVAVSGYALLMVLLLSLNLAGIDRLDLMLALLFAGYGFLGLVVPSTAVLALDDHGEIAGTASALMGTLQFVAGVLVMALVGAFVDGSARPMLAGIAGCAVVAFVLAQLTLRRR